MASSQRHRLTLVVFVALLLTFLSINVWMVAPYLLSLLMGGILAVLTRPLYHRLMDRGMRRSVASLLVVLGISLLVIVPISLFAWQAIKQGVAFGQQLSQDGSLDFDRLLRRVSNWKLTQHFVQSPDQLEAAIRQRMSGLGQQASAVLLAILAGIPGQILQVFLSLLTCYFLLTDGARFRAWVDDKLPLDRDVRNHIYSSFRNTTVGTIWATLAASTVQTLIMFAAYLVLGVPGAFLAAGATFLFTWIPLVGSTPVWVVGSAYLFLNDSPTRGVLMLVFGLICGISDNFVRPWVLKGRGDMHPLVSLVSIFGGIQLFGLFGVFFGPILTSVFLSLAQVWPTLTRRFDLVDDSPLVAPPRGLTKSPASDDPDSLERKDA